MSEPLWTPSPERVASARLTEFREIVNKTHGLALEGYDDIVQPVLLLWGEDDVVTTLDNGHRLRAQLPNASLITFGDCGHFPMIEAASASANALQAFLSADETQP